MDYQNIRIQQIEYFLAIAKHLNFTDASKSLYISQPTLSKQIALFEEAINAQLFERNKRSVSLTPAGLILYDKLGSVLNEIDLAIEQARHVSEGYNARLKIGCLESLDSGDFLVSAADYFKEKVPEVLLTYEKHTFKELRNLMLCNELDIIFTFSFETENLPNYEFRNVWETNSSIVLSKSHPKANIKSLSLEDVKDEPFIMLSRENSPNGFDGIVQLCRKHGFAPKVAQFVPNLQSLLLCVECNLGIAILDANFKFPNSSKVVQHPVHDDFIRIVAVWKKDNANPAIKLYIDTLF
jgi:DNA-binding transcriptional LysR family regulator